MKKQMKQLAIMISGLLVMGSANAVEFSPRAYLGAASYKGEIDNSSFEKESSYTVLGAGITLFNQDWNVDLFHQLSLGAEFDEDGYEDDFSQSNTALTIGKRVDKATLYFGIKAGSTESTYDPVVMSGLEEETLGHTVLFVGGNYSFLFGSTSSLTIGLSLGAGIGELEGTYEFSGTETADGTAMAANFNIGFSSFFTESAGYTLQISSQVIDYSDFEWESGESFENDFSETTTVISAQVFAYF